MNIAVHTDRAFILSRLTDDARDQGDQLGEIATVQFQLADLSASHGARQIGRLRFDLRNGCTFDHHFRTGSAHLERDIDARLFGHVELDASGLELLEPGRDDDNVVGPGRETRLVVFAGGVCCHLASDAMLGIRNRDVGAGNGSSSCIGHSTGDRAGGLRPTSCAEHQDQRNH